MDADGHILTIMALSELFQNDDDIEKIINADNKADIIEILKKY
jgi:PTS system ascorbate-specific IIA component